MEGQLSFQTRAIRTWRVMACLPFGKHMVPAEDTPPGELPKQRVAVSRIPTVVTEAFGRKVAVRPYEDPGGMPPLAEGVELAALIVLLEAPSADVALTNITDTLEAVIQTLSFQMQQAFTIVQLEVLDVTQPVVVGEDREMILYPFPTGYPIGRFAQSVELGSIQTTLVPDLSAAYPPLDRKARAAMDWYIKGLAAAFSTDQFMLFWIALEKLWERSGIRVEVPYTVQRCGHVVEHCPICNASTKKKVFGAGVKEYLTEQFGLEPQLAKELWGMRQMLHGAKDLDSKEVQEISRLVQIVRACVATELKDQFGLAADQPPFVTFGVPAVAPQVALGGSRKLTGDDLAGLLS